MKKKLEKQQLIQGKFFGSNAVLTAVKMRVKVTTLFCVICSLGNILHVYQICDEYLRYDVTTNVQVTVADEIPFPSITLCVDLIDSLQWTTFTNETRRKLIPFTDEATLSRLAHDPHAILSIMQTVRQETVDFFSVDHFRRVVYANLVKELSVVEIINASASLSDMVDKISITKLLYNESELMTMRKEDRVSNGQVSFDTNESHNVQFTIDMTYIHLREKCIVMRPQPELQNTINYDDQISRSGIALITFGGQYSRPIRVMVLKHGYLNTLTDTWINALPNRKVISSFVTHSSTLLEYPYKTNCRDYSKTGIMSRSQCRQECFRTLSISRFNGILQESYAFPSDTISLKTIPKDNEYLFEDILEQCKQTCFQRDCQSLVYIQSQTGQTHMTYEMGIFRDTCSLNDTSESQKKLCKKQKRVQKSYLYTLLAEGNPGTSTETQPAIPLISFLTGLFSTFGFWLGLSVFGSANFIQTLWSKTRKNKKLKSRTQQDVVRIISQQQPTLHGNLQQGKHLKRQRVTGYSWDGTIENGYR